MTTDGPDQTDERTPVVSGPTPQQQARHDALATLRASGMDPYPEHLPRPTSLRLAHEAARSDKNQTVSVVGRVVQLRDLDGAVLALLREGVVELQAVLAPDAVDPAALDLFRRTVGSADQVSVTGTTGRSDDGEPSLTVTSWTMAAKALTPAPDRPADPVARARLRHMELALDDDVADRVRARSAAIASLRTTLAWDSFTEVDTPVLQRVPGGGAPPFRTRLDGFDQDLYLRTSAEPYLRRLVVAGLGKVFEVGRSFRNQPADASHNPELTCLDACQAYGDYTAMRLLAQKVVRTAAGAMLGAAVAHRPGGAKVRLDGPDWPVVAVHDAVSQAVDAASGLTPSTPLEEVRAVCRRTEVAWQDDEPAGVLVARLYDRFVVPATDAPVFYVDFPVETSPSARAHRTDPRLAERWDLVAFGVAVGTACSGLADPVEQRRRLTSDGQAVLDEDYLAALEFGLLPTGSLSLGIDQMVTMLLGTTVRDVVTFPFVH